MTEFYDLYLYEGCLRLPEPEDLQQDLEGENEVLVLFATTLLDPACREQMLMPGLIKLSNSFSLTGWCSTPRPMMLEWKFSSLPALTWQRN